MKSLRHVLVTAATGIALAATALVGGCAGSSGQANPDTPCSPSASATRAPNLLGKGHEFTLTGVATGEVDEDIDDNGTGSADTESYKKTYQLNVATVRKVEQASGKAAGWFKSHAAPFVLYAYNADGSSLAETRNLHNQVPLGDVQDWPVRITGAIAEQQDACGNITDRPIMFKVQELAS